MLAAIRKEFAMKRWILAGLAGAGLALAFGCDDSSADSADDDAAPGAASLADTRWRLAAWSASARDPADFEITAEFAAGRIGGRSAVNSYGGDCSATADGEFSVGALAMTEMAGEPTAMQAESLYLSLLAQARRWRIASAQLVLSADAQDLLIFDPR